MEEGGDGADDRCCMKFVRTVCHRPWHKCWRVKGMRLHSNRVDQNDARMLPVVLCSWKKNLQPAVNASLTNYYKMFTVDLWKGMLPRHLSSLATGPWHSTSTFQDRHIKLDKQALPQQSASCFGDATELLLKTFYVVQLEYPFWEANTIANVNWEEQLVFGSCRWTWAADQH